MPAPSFRPPPDRFKALLGVQAGVAYYEGGGRLEGSESRMVASEPPLPLYVAYLRFETPRPEMPEWASWLRLEQAKAQLRSGVAPDSEATGASNPVAPVRPAGLAKGAAENRVKEAQEEYDRERLRRLVPVFDQLRKTPGWDEIWVCSPAGFERWKGAIIPTPDWKTLTHAQDAAKGLGVSRDDFRVLWHGHVDQLKRAGLIKSTSKAHVKNPRYEFDINRMDRILDICGVPYSEQVRRV